MPVYLYWGEEEFNLNNEVKELRKKVLDQNFSALNHKMLREPDVRDLLEAIQTLPMMFGNLLVEVQASSIFMRGKRKLSSSDPLMQKLTEVIEKLDSRVHLLLICPIERDSGKKIDSVIKLTKTIQKIGEVREFPAFKFYQEDKVVDWMMKQASAKSIKINKNAALSLLQNTGSDLRKIDSELEKIKTAIHPKTTITIDDVKEVASTNENVFLFADYLLNSQPTDSLKELRKLTEKNHPLKIIATLQTTTRKWLKIKLESKTKNSYEIAKIVNLPPFVVEQDIKKIRNIPEERLFSLREKVKDTEFKMKSGELPPEMAMELLCLAN